VLVATTQTRHDDIVIQRRIRTHGATHAVTQVYAVTYPSHDDQATECNSYEDAERAALGWPKAEGSRCGTRRARRAAVGPVSQRYR
jgi:hypothetical protein